MGACTSIDTCLLSLYVCVGECISPHSSPMLQRKMVTLPQSKFEMHYVRYTSIVTLKTHQ